MSNEMSRAEYDQAKQDFVAGNYGNALALLDKLAQKFPSEKEILHSRAQCLAKLERAEEAVAACDQLTTIYSDPRGEQLRAALISAGAQSPSVNPLSAHRRAGSFPVRKAALTSGIAVAVIAAVAASYWSLHTDYDPTKPYIIHFPKEQSAGKVRNALSPEGAWSGESPAQGDYTLPAGFVLHLELNEDGARDYSFLTRVAPEVLVSVSCFAENLDPTQFDVFGRFKKMTSFKIGRAQLGDAELEYLKNMTDLRVIWWGAQPTTSAGLLQLAALAKLEELNIDGTSVNDEGLKILSNYPRLKRLSLGGTQVEGFGLENIVDKEGFEELTLNYMRKLNHTVAPTLNSLGNLRRLNVSGLQPGLDSRGYFAIIHNFTKLESLWIIDTPFGDEVIDGLINMPNLRELHCENTKITKAGLIRLLVARPDLKGIHEGQWR